MSSVWGEEENTKDEMKKTKANFSIKDRPFMFPPYPWFFIRCTDSIINIGQHNPGVKNHYRFFSSLLEK
jgi:hypothetical protein